MSNINNLLEIMARLRDPQHGCPWDKEQTFSSVLPFTIEEVYEVAEAIDQGDMVALREELGDLLFQVVFHARMAEEAGQFKFDDVVDSIAGRLVERHPHVFADANIVSSEAQTLAWEQHKEKERAASAASAGRLPSALDNVPLALPGLMRAAKLQRRAARVGFDWPDISPVLDKMEEEIAELREALAGGNKKEIKHEIGDIFFACVNLARHTDIDPEVSVRSVNHRFETRFRRVEELAAADGGLQTKSLEEMNRYWDQAKKEEKAGKL